MDLYRPDLDEIEREVREMDALIAKRTNREAREKTVERARLLRSRGKL
jgi:hypothetical protein